MAKKTKKKVLIPEVVPADDSALEINDGSIEPVLEVRPKKTAKKKSIKAMSAAIGDGKSLTISDPMALYLAEVRKYPLLTKEEEQIWAKRYVETKDPKAAEKLVTANLRFVVKIAAEYSKFGAKMIDLVQEGNVGLMHAVREFNPYKGVRLITYAVWWIRGYIQEYLMRQYSLVRMGTTQNQRKLFYQLQQEKQKLESLGRDAGIKLLSSKLGISEEEIDSMEQRMSHRDVSLDQPLDSESKSTLMDLQTGVEVATADEVLEHEEEMGILKEKIEEIRHRLNDKEQFILENRLLSDSPLTLQEIGDKYGITRERARQLENRVLDKLKKTYDEDAEQDAKEVGPLKAD
ncbi:MAG: RNA polymerase factor sigma-32 [Bdellovibrionales bacterium]